MGCLKALRLVPWFYAKMFGYQWHEGLCGRWYRVPAEELGAPWCDVFLQKDAVIGSDVAAMPGSP